MYALYKEDQECDCLSCSHQNNSKDDVDGSKYKFYQIDQTLNIFHGYIHRLNTKYIQLFIEFTVDQTTATINSLTFKMIMHQVIKICSNIKKFYVDISKSKILLMIHQNV